MKHDLCGCGTLEDAFDAALNDVTKSVAAGECLNWQIAVAAARVYLARRMCIELGAQDGTELATKLGLSIGNMCSTFKSDPAMFNKGQDELKRAMAMYDLVHAAVTGQPQ